MDSDISIGYVLAAVTVLSLLIPLAAVGLIILSEVKSREWPQPWTRCEMITGVLLLGISIGILSAKGLGIK